MKPYFIDTWMQVWDIIVENGWQHKERIEWFGQYSSGDTIANIYNLALEEYLKQLFNMNHAKTIVKPFNNLKTTI